MRTKAFRRHHQERVIVNRVKNRYAQWSTHKTKSFAKTLEEVKSGENHQEIKSMSTYCSCWMCRGERYTKKDRQVKIDLED